MFRIARLEDVDKITDIFMNNLQENREYISHGEIQMGIADESHNIKPDGGEKWKEYITGKIDCIDPTLPSSVIIFEEEGAIKAFSVLELMEDGDAPFGVICDMLVLESLRGKGIGSRLFTKSMEWFKAQGIADIYLESGKDNHKAHGFFEKMGFHVISHIFKHGVQFK